MHPYRIALQLLQFGRSTYRYDNNGHFWRISDYSGRPIYRQRHGNTGEPPRGSLLLAHWMRPVHRCGRAQHRLLPEVGTQVIVSRYWLGQRFPQYYRGRRFPRGRVPHFSRGELKSKSFKYNEGLHDRQSVLITFRDRRKSFLICKRLDTAKEFSRRKLSFQPGSQVCVRTRITCGVAKFRRFL